MVIKMEQSGTVAIHGMAEVKLMKSRGTCAVVIEIPMEHYRQAVGAFHDYRALVVLAEPKGIGKETPYGLFDMK